MGVFQLLHIFNVSKDRGAQAGRDSLGQMMRVAFCVMRALLSPPPVTEAKATTLPPAPPAHHHFNQQQQPNEMQGRQEAAAEAG